MAEYSYLVLNLPRGTSRDLVRRILTDHAEYGQWELARLRMASDGSRTATLRRKIIRPGGATASSAALRQALSPCRASVPRLRAAPFACPAACRRARSAHPARTPRRHPARPGAYNAVRVISPASLALKLVGGAACRGMLRLPSARFASRAGPGSRCLLRYPLPGAGSSCVRGPQKLSSGSSARPAATPSSAATPEPAAPDPSSS